MAPLQLTRCVLVADLRGRAHAIWCADCRVDDDTRARLSRTKAVVGIGAAAPTPAKRRDERPVCLMDPSATGGGMMLQASVLGREQPITVITGATGGIGRWIALGMARAGHHVALIGRDRARGMAAQAWINRNVPRASTELLIARPFVALRNASSWRADRCPPFEDLCADQQCRGL